MSELLQRGVLSPEGYLAAVGVNPQRPGEEVAILVFNEDVFLGLARATGVEVGSGHRGGRRRFYRLSQNGAQARVFLSGDGGPVAAMAVEILAARGAKAIIGLGYVGSLRPEVAIGDFVIPLAAIRDEGTSSHYLPPACPAVSNHTLVQLLVGAVERYASSHVGLLWSTDAPFRETPADVRRWRSVGALAVDMETAAVLSVCQALGLPAACLQIVSDDLSSLEWRAGYQESAAQLPQAAQIVLDVIPGIAQLVSPTSPQNEERENA